MTTPQIFDPGPLQGNPYAPAYPNGIDGQQRPVPQRTPWRRGVAFLVHADAKAGKSSLGDTGPRPRLLMDAEGGTEGTPSRKIEWDPARTTPPQPGRHVTVGYGPDSITAEWDSAQVYCRDFRTFLSVHQTLAEGRHPFNSVTVDSTTEAQQQIIFGLAGWKQLEQRDWGVLGRQVTGLTRMWKDLASNPVRKVWSVCFICGTHPDKNTGKLVPLLQGTQSQDFLPYYPDVTGYLYHDPSGSGARLMQISYNPKIETGERVGGRLPGIMPIAYPGYQGWNLESMVAQVIST